MGMFASPNRAAVMNSLPPGDRGAGGGMNQTFQNSAQVLSVGIFFSLMIAGLASSLPHTLSIGAAGARRRRCQTPTAIAHAPPVSVLFAAFLGYNPIQNLAGPHVLAAMSAHGRAIVTGRAFFPAADLGSVPRGPARGVRVRDHRLPGRRGGVRAARRPLPPRGAAPAGEASRPRRSAAAGAGLILACMTRCCARSPGSAF